MERAFTGDREACSRLFAANWGIVYGWMLGFTRDRIEAEDLTQQAFLRAYTRLPQLRDHARFLPWLRKVARTVALGRRPRREVALRPEPFGALAYHYDTRKLVFLKHPDVVRVVRSLADHATVADALAACKIDKRRWPSFDKALTSLYESEMLHERSN